MINTVKKGKCQDRPHRRVSTQGIYNRAGAAICRSALAIDESSSTGLSSVYVVHFGEEDVENEGIGIDLMKRGVRPDHSGHA
jgi:hypothetical protein